MAMSILMMLSATYGRGVIFSALPVGVLQGGVTLCASLVTSVFHDAIVQNMSFIGSILIFCVGKNLAFQAKFRVANMLPALVVGAVYVMLMG